jgi:hypothetical protein
MSKVRYTFSAVLEVKSPLHVGSGEVRNVDTVRGKAGQNDGPKVAAIVRDCESKPYIPATALKSLCLRTARALPLPDDMIWALFGRIKEEDGTGGMGAILFRGTSQLAAGPAVGLPYVDLGPGVFVAARTAIDGRSGTADEHKLFFQEMVAPGATFPVRMLLESRDEGLAERQAAALMQVLDALTGGLGSLGKNQADGQGRVQLKPHATTVVYDRLGKTGAFERGTTHVTPATQPAAVPACAVKHWTLTLTCPGPFMIVDSSFAPVRIANVPPTGPQLKAQRAANLPLVLGSSLSGVLRQRAAWLAELATLQSRPYGADTLNRLFGRAEFRALLQIDSLTVDSAEAFDITSVKLDRFSGGPIDHALFKSATFRDVVITVRLSLTQRPGETEIGIPTADDLRLAVALITDIKTKGLNLGHGGNKGFGWFTVQEL